jgi:hypothetical protein
VDVDVDVEGVLEDEDLGRTEAMLWSEDRFSRASSSIERILERSSAGGRRSTTSACVR